MATSVDALIVNKLNAGHIRKGKKVAVLVAPMSVAIPAAITTGGTAVGVPITLAELPGFEPIGLLKKDDGVPMSRDRNKSDVMAVGFNDPVRSDFTSDTFSAKIVALETRRATIEKFLQVDLSTVTPNVNTGEVTFPQPSDGIVGRARWMFIAQDGVGADRFWWARLFTAGVVSATDDQNMGAVDDPWTWPMTISSETDTDSGYGVRHYYAGPGWQARLTTMGFTA